MHKIKSTVRDVFQKGDMLLLALCVIASIYGIVMIYAATAYSENSRYIIIQTSCLFVGVLLYLAITAVDVDILAGQRTILFIFNAFIMLLLLVWGTDNGSGNWSWLDIPLLPFNVQPAEIAKVFYVIILAKTMSVNQNRISSPKSVLSLAFHMLFIVGLILVLSRDMGVALIYVFAFIVMAYAGGVKGWWFLIGIAGFAAAAPIFWQYGMAEYQKNRILALIDPSIDPTGLNELWQTNLNMKALRNGGLTGMGLFQGTMTNNATLPARHTDSIFCTIGEQLGLVGCLLTLLLLFAIVARAIYVGIKSPDYMNRLICFGIASLFLFQILINVGVCLGLVPVIGLVLPFISYGGSSMLTSFMAMGFVSSIKMRPSRDISAHYIRPY